MYWVGNGMDGWSYVLMIVSTVLFWGVLITGIVMLLRYLAGNGARQQGSADPKAILAERFARGQIDEAAYRSGLELLEAGRLQPRA